MRRFDNTITEWHADHMRPGGVWYNWQLDYGGHPDGTGALLVSQCIRRMRLLIDLELPFYIARRNERRKYAWATK